MVDVTVWQVVGEILNRMTHFCQERNAEGIGAEIEDVSMPRIMETRGVDSGCAVPQNMHDIFKWCGSCHRSAFSAKRQYS